jgi:hypothetical protein
MIDLEGIQDLKENSNKKNSSSKCGSCHWVTVDLKETQGLKKNLKKNSVLIRNNGFSYFSLSSYTI